MGWGAQVNSLKKIRLVLADDHPLVAEGLKSILEPHFDVVGTASGGREAVEKAISLRAHAVLLDIGMPGLNGVEAARQIKTLAPKIKVIFVTQMEDRAYVRAAFQAGGSAYILKQAAPAEIVDGIRAALAGNLFISKSLRTPEMEALLQGAPNPTTLFGGQLTSRQREVLQLIAEGKSAKEIAGELGISTRTVEFHKNAMMSQLGLHTTAELTRYALQEGIAPYRRVGLRRD